VRQGENYEPIDPAVHLAMALKRARAKYACSLRKLSEKAGVSPSFLSRIENAQERPPDHILVVYAKSFRVDADELFRLAGRIPSDMVAHLVKSPRTLKQIRAEMAQKAVRNGEQSNNRS